jgi:hypothetical protein
MAWNKELLDKVKAEHDPLTFRAATFDRIGPRLKPINEAPPLRRINGFGLGLYGRLRHPAIPRGYLKLYFFTALWLPVIPLCAFAVTPTGGGFHFHQSMSLWGVVRAFGWRTVPFYLTALIEGAFWLVTFASLILGVMLSLRWLFTHYSVLANQSGRNQSDRFMGAPPRDADVQRSCGHFSATISGAASSPWRCELRLVYAREGA